MKHAKLLASLESLEGFYWVGDGHVRGRECLPAHEGTHGAEKKLKVLHRVVALHLSMKKYNEANQTRKKQK